MRLPDGEDTWAQWFHKAQYAYNARSLSLLLQRDGVAELARYVTREDDDSVLIFNPLPWSAHPGRSAAAASVNVRRRVEDGTAGHHHLDRRHTLLRHVEDLPKLVRNPAEERYILPPSTRLRLCRRQKERPERRACLRTCVASGGGFQARYDGESNSLHPADRSRHRGKSPLPRHL
ncbi:MAG: hypothetical protein R2873_14120 [Caldilineaceae bacterium]